jgi:hypothetical protein
METFETTTPLLYTFGIFYLYQTRNKEDSPEMPNAKILLKEDSACPLICSILKVHESQNHDKHVYQGVT